MATHADVLKGVKPRDYRDEMAKFVDEGWKMSRTNGGHLRLIHDKAAHPVFAPMTPSDHRSAMNVRRDAKASLRAGVSQACISQTPVEEQWEPDVVGRKRKPRWSPSDRLTRSGRQGRDPVATARSRGPEKPAVDPVSAEGPGGPETGEPVVPASEPAATAGEVDTDVIAITADMVGASILIEGTWCIVDLPAPASTAEPAPSAEPVAAVRNLPARRIAWSTAGVIARGLSQDWRSLDEILTVGGVGLEITPSRRAGVMRRLRDMIIDGSVGESFRRENLGLVDTFRMRRA